MVQTWFSCVRATAQVVVQLRVTCAICGSVVCGMVQMWFRCVWYSGSIGCVQRWFDNVFSGGADVYVAWFTYGSDVCGPVLWFS